MERSIDEKLFFTMMCFSHQMKRDMKDRGPRGCGKHRGPEACPKMGCPRGHHGPGQEGPWGDAPEMRGPHGPHGPHGAHGSHGPHGPQGDPRKMEAFAQTRLMSLLLDHEEGVRQKVLAEEMRINPSSTSELISKLESEGYVARTLDPADKRATLIALTELGRARTYELEDERNEKFARVFEALDPQEKEQLLGLLEKLLPAPEAPEAPEE